MRCVQVQQCASQGLGAGLARNAVDRAARNALRLLINRQHRDQLVQVIFNRALGLTRLLHLRPQKVNLLLDALDLNRSIGDSHLPNSITKFVDADVATAVDIESIEDFQRVRECHELCQSGLVGLTHILDLVTRKLPGTVFVQSQEDLPQILHKFLLLLIFKYLEQVLILHCLLQSTVHYDRSHQVHAHNAHHKYHDNEIRCKPGVHLDHRLVDENYVVEGHELQQGQHTTLKRIEVLIHQGLETFVGGRAHHERV
mmetsp:Transcript_121968/g.304350  ORF Transcript_121968/g.304350 Transcript_121968/m.304350 type:complete len:256 (-) Transcript_121968:29-796(-)